MYGIIREEFDEFHGCWIPDISSIELYKRKERRDRALARKENRADVWERYTDFDNPIIKQ